MTGGVKISEDIDPELREKLGLEFNAKLSFLWGVSYPLPKWYPQLSRCQQGMWFLYQKFGDILTILLLASNLMKVCTDYDDIRVFTTCVGTTTYIFCWFVKITTFRKKSKILGDVLDRIHHISGNLDQNPMKNEQFFEIHHSYFHYVKFFGLNKTLAIGGGVCTLAIFKMVHGFFQSEPKDRHLPMAGWFPYDPYVNPQFSISCIFQMFSYLSFLLKDVTVDLLFLSVLVTLNTHLIYLGKLIGLILEEDGAIEGGMDHLEQMNWWVQQHQSVLR